MEHAKQEEHETIGEDTMDQIEAAYSEIALLRNQLARLLAISAHKVAPRHPTRECSEMLLG